MAHLRCASVYQVTTKSVSYGRLCEMWSGVHGMPVRDVEWRAWDACAVAAYIGQNCGGH